MRLIHLANWKSTNVGNGALIYGTERVIREDFPEASEFIPEPWDDYTFGLRQFDQSFVDRVNATDGLLIGGAVAFNGRSSHQASGWRFDLPLNLWESIRKPVVVYGASYRVWPGEPYAWSRLNPALDYVIGHPKVLFAVRNDGTRHWLKRPVEEIPDPGLFVPTEPTCHSELVDHKTNIYQKTNIILALNNEDEHYRFERENSKAFGLWNIARALEQLDSMWDLNLILVPHSLDDFKIIGELFPLLPSVLAYQNTVVAGLHRRSQSSQLYDLYKHAHLAISMRVHSMSPCIGLQTPMIAISTQDRIATFMKNADLEDFLLDFFDPDLAEKLARKVDTMLRNRFYVRRCFKRTTDIMRDHLWRFNQRVYDLFSH